MIRESKLAKVRRLNFRGGPSVREISRSTGLCHLSRRVVYDNMTSAEDKVLLGKRRMVNARFQAMCSHSLFKPALCNVASGWEKGIVERSVQDRRRQQVWRVCGGGHQAALA